MIREQDLTKKSKCKHVHCSPMLSSAWSDLNKGEITSKLPDFCQELKCNCQKQVTFTPKQFHFEVGSKKGKLRIKIRGTQKA